MKSLIVSLLFIMSGANAAEPGQSRYLSPATFGIDARALHTKSAFALLTDEFFGGQTLAVKVLYTPKDITPADEGEIRAHGDRAFSEGTEHAVLVLFIDKSNQVWQVNLTVVLKGQTVGYTVASSSEGFKRIASTYSFDGKQLRLKSAGKFENASWKVDDNLPVFTFKKPK